MQWNEKTSCEMHTKSDFVVNVSVIESRTVVTTVTVPLAPTHRERLEIEVVGLF